MAPPKKAKRKAERLRPPAKDTMRRWAEQADENRLKRERFEDRVVGALEGMAEAFGGMAEALHARAAADAKTANAQKRAMDMAARLLKKMERSGAFGGRSNADLDPDAREFAEFREPESVDDVVARSLREDAEERAKRERVKQEHPDVTDADYEKTGDAPSDEGGSPLDPT